MSSTTLSVGDSGSDVEDDSLPLKEDAVHKMVGNSGTSQPWWHKWTVVGASSFAWLSVYYATWCPSFIEDSLITEYGFSSSEYSYIISVCYLGAAVGSFWSSFGLMKTNHNHLIVLIMFLLILFLSHYTFTMVLYYYDIVFLPYLWILISRFFVGICIGALDTIIQSMVNYWFQNDQSLIGVAFGILISMLEVGLLIGRYLQPFVKNLIGVALSLMAVGLGVIMIALLIAIFVRIVIVNCGEPSVDNMTDNNNNNNENSNSKVSFINQFKLLKQLSMYAWLAIIIFVIYNAIINTIYSTMIEPFVSIYGYSEQDADYLWSISSWAALSLLIIYTKLMDHLNCYIESSIGGMIAFFMAFLLVSLALNAVVAVSLTVIGLITAPSCFAMLAITIENPQLAPIGTAFATAVGWIASLLSTNAIGWIYDSTYSYKNSVTLIYCIALLGLIICLILFRLDKQRSLQGGVLHMKYWNH